MGTVVGLIEDAEEINFSRSQKVFDKWNSELLTGKPSSFILRKKKGSSIL